VSRTRLLRLFWIGAAAILVAAALVALAAVVGGRFDETDGKILGTLGTALLAGAAATSGAALVEAKLAAGLGAVVATTSPVWFAVIAVALWRNFDGDLGKASATGYVVLAAELVVATARLLVGPRRRLLPLFGATAGCVALATVLTTVAIWRDRAGSGWGKAIAAFWILGVLGYLLVPVARRLTGAPGAGPPRRVDLAAGIELGRARIHLARTAPAVRESLYIVVTGRARIGELELAAGDAALVPAGAIAELDAGSQVVTVETR
jgi:hypothetical protein